MDLADTFSDAGYELASGRLTLFLRAESTEGAVRANRQLLDAFGLARTRCLQLVKAYRLRRGGSKIGAYLRHVDEGAEAVHEHILLRGGAALAQALVDIGFDPASGPTEELEHVAALISWCHSQVGRAQQMGHPSTDLRSTEECWFEFLRAARIQHLAHSSTEDAEMAHRLESIRRETLREMFELAGAVGRALAEKPEAVFAAPAVTLAAAAAASDRVDRMNAETVRLLERINASLRAIANDFLAALPPDANEDMEWAHGLMGNACLNILSLMFHSQSTDTSRFFSSGFVRSLPFYINFAHLALTEPSENDDADALLNPRFGPYLQALVREPRKFPHLGVPPEMHHARQHLLPLASALRSTPPPPRLPGSLRGGGVRRSAHGLSRCGHHWGAARAGGPGPEGGPADP